MKTVDYKKWAAITVLAVGAGLLLWLFFRFLLLLLLPFAVALALAISTRRVVLALARRTPIGERAAAVLVTALFLALTALVLWFFGGWVFAQAGRLSEDLLEKAQTPTGGVSRFLFSLAQLPLWDRLRAIPLFADAVGDPQAFFAEQLRRAAGEIAAGISAALLAAVGRLPALLFGLIVTVIACFYVAADYPRVTGALCGLLPSAWREKLPAARERAATLTRRIIFAYGLLFLLTFGELALGFLLLRRPYALLLAFLTALLDILPVLGVGMVLIPYAAAAFLAGDTALGFGLLVLYAIMTVVRQWAEPHLVGKSIGVHPLLTLFSLFAGVRLFGFAGLLAAPLLALCLHFLIAAAKTEKRGG